MNEHAERELYNGSSPDCSYIFQKNRIDSISGNGKYFPEYEYVVAWYDSRLIKKRQNNQSHVNVKFINLTKPTYSFNTKDNRNVVCQSILHLSIPIDYFHYFPIGSIWKNAKPIGQFKLNEYEVTVEVGRKNVSYCSFLNETNKQNNQPFNYYLYTDIPAEHNKYKRDENQLIKILHNHQNFIIHPLQLFITHYGYSTVIKRILSTYNWSDVLDRLCTTKDELTLFNQKHVVMPKYFVKKDSIFLYHLKYDEQSYNIIKRLSNSIVIANTPLSVTFWHNQDVRLKIRGIKLDNTILCAEIIGMNQPTGEAIKMVYLPRSKTADLNKNSTDMQRVPIIKSYVRECDLESINSKFTNEEPNNYTVEYIKKQFLTIGQERQLNALYLSKESQSNIKVIAIEPNSISSLGIGDEKGENGNVGLAHCFLDTEVDNKELRLYRLWEQAKCFALDNHGNAHWFTPNLGFCNNDELVFLSLESKNGWINYPEIAIVIRIILEKEAFYIIDFSMEKYDISLRGVAYKPDYTEDFISFNNTKKSKLFEIICEIVTEEHLSKEYIYKQKNKIATFNHSGADSSNWIYNGIKKITDRKLNKPKNLYK